jgi:hypothetical protein
MKTSKWSPLIACVTTILAITVVLPLQSATVKSSGSGTSAARWSIQVDQVDPGTPDLSYSFQAAIYENLVDELKKTKQFQEVFREGDHRLAKPQSCWCSKQPWRNTQLEAKRAAQ